MFTIFGLYAFCSMLLFFCYLCAARVGIADYTSLTVIGVGHFFGFTVCIVYLVYFALYMLVTEEYVIRLTLDRYKSLIDMVCCVLMAFWIGWTCIAYWSADKVRSQDVVYYFLQSKNLSRDHPSDMKNFFLNLATSNYKTFMFPYQITIYH